jgi:hypothetical protein
MATCGPGNPCKGDNECCNGTTGKCGVMYDYYSHSWDCSDNSKINLCGACTRPDCFYKAKSQCQKQFNEYIEKKDCKFTRGECIDGKSKITIIEEASNFQYSSPVIKCPTDEYEDCNNCIISDWTPCDATNYTRTRIRTQAINGKACTEYENKLPLYEECSHCIISDWTACTNNTRTRKRRQAINGNKACTQYQNELPLTQTCTNCEITEWTNCLNNIRTRIITKFAINTDCPDEKLFANSLIQNQTCRDCVVSSNDWTGPCINNVRIKEITTFPINTYCPNLQTCNNCIGNWSNWTDCKATCDGKFNFKIGSRTKKFTILHPPTNGGVSCDIEDGKIETDNNCKKECTIGSTECSEWSKCDCNTNEISRSCDDNKYIQKKKCSENELCKCSQNWSKWSVCDCSTKTITRSCYDIIEEKNCNNENCNIINYIINFLKLIILFIMNLFK